MTFFDFLIGMGIVGLCAVPAIVFAIAMELDKRR